jgi:hypothetical protein
MRGVRTEFLAWAPRCVCAGRAVRFCRRRCSRATAIVLLPDADRPVNQIVTPWRSAVAAMSPACCCRACRLRRAYTYLLAQQRRTLDGGHRASVPRDVGRGHDTVQTWPRRRGTRTCTRSLRASERWRGSGAGRGAAAAVGARRWLSCLTPTHVCACEPWPRRLSARHAMTDSVAVRVRACQ